MIRDQVHVFAILAIKGSIARNVHQPIICLDHSVTLEFSVQMIVAGQALVITIMVLVTVSHIELELIVKQWFAVHLVHCVNLAQ